MRLIALCAAALVGVALGDLWRLEAHGLLFDALVALLGAGLAWRHPRWRWLALCAGALAAGALRSSMLEPAPVAPLEPYVGQVVRLGGSLDEAPTLSSTAAAARLTLEVHTVNSPGRDPPNAVEGRANVIGDPAAFGFLASPDAAPGAASGSLPFLGGDHLLLEGRVVAADSRAPPTLLFPRLLDHRPAEQPPPPMTAIANLRTLAAAGIQRYLPEPQGSLAIGVLLGGSGRLDADFRLQLQRSGLAHLVAIDGYKQVVVAAALGTVSVRLLGVRLATLPILLGIAGYTLLTGAHPSAVRAALMVGLATLAALTGRVADPLTSLMLALVVMAALDPRIVLDVGLQLSLSAVLGIVLLWPRLRRLLRGTPGFVAEPVGLTLAVTLATLPVVLNDFQSVSLVSPVAHILAVPLLPPTLIGSAALATVAWYPPVAGIVAWLAWLPSTALVEVIRFFGSLPGAALSTGRLPAAASLALAAALLAWGAWGLPEAAGLRQWWKGLRVPRRAWSLPAASMAACLAAVGVLQVTRPDGRLHIQTLALDRGEAIFIRGPTGRTVLVVGGRVNSSLLAGQLADHLAVWEHKLDGVVCVDAAAEAGIDLVLTRYADDQRLNAAQGGRIDLGGGAALDVSASAASTPQRTRVAVSYGRVWLPLVGRPPPPVFDDPLQASPAATLARLSGLADTSHLVSDGTELWSDGA